MSGWNLAITFIVTSFSDFIYILEWCQEEEVFSQRNRTETEDKMNCKVEEEEKHCKIEEGDKRL